MVYQDPNKNNCVALVTCETKPSKPSADEVAKSFADIGKVKKLAKFEIPTKVCFRERHESHENQMQCIRRPSISGCPGLSVQASWAGR